MCRRGSVGLMTGVALVPLIAAAGAGIDMARLGLAKAALQAAVDDAALAGATAYQSANASGTASAVALSYFNLNVGTLANLVAITGATATPAQGVNAYNYSSYNVTVAATGTMSASLMSIVNIRSMTVEARATAANPVVQPIVTLGFVGANAADWNAVFMYAVPNNANGTPDYAAYPPLSQVWQVGSNCNAGSSFWTSNARCNGQPGAVAPTTQSFPSVAATTPLGFALVNMRRGLDAPNTAYASANQYGAAPGNLQILSTGPMSLGQGPAQNTDNSPAIWKLFTGITLNQPATHYSDVNKTNTPNCALIIQQVDPNNLPTSPPTSGQCYSTSDSRTGQQFANSSCSQLAGRTMMYWWNDMGGGTDDVDYNDFYYTLRCAPGTASPNGGTFATGAPASASRTVALIQ